MDEATPAGNSVPRTTSLQHPKLEKRVAPPPHRSELLRAALSYAEACIPIFPLYSIDGSGKCTCRKGAGCESPGKHPRTKSGYLDATTNPQQITAWWNRWPDANIGIPTGERSGWLVLDNDPDKGGWESLEALEAEHGTLPATRRHKTGGGGLHDYYIYPTGANIRNSAGLLGPGLDIRGEGGYIVAPPSVTESAYEPLNDLPLAEPPEWLLDALRTPRGGAKGYPPGQSRSSPPVSIDIAGSPISEGTRDVTLTSIAGRLHDGTRNLEELVAALSEINEARCEPPLPEAQVWKIAASIHPRPSCKTGAKPPNKDTLAFLSAYEELADGGTWKGHRKGQQSLLKTYIQQARKYGHIVEDGVAVSMSNMQAALANGVSDRTVRNNNRKLESGGYIRHANKDRKPEEAGTIVLLASALTTVSAQTFLTSTIEEDMDSLGKFAQRPWTAPRARNSCPVYEGGERVGTIRRMGKGGEAAVDSLEQSGGGLWDTELAERLGLSRVRDLYRDDGWLERLEESGAIEITEGYIALTGNWLEQYNDRRERDREIEDYKRDLKRYDERRKNNRERLEAHKLARMGLSDEEVAEALEIGVEGVRRHLGRSQVARQEQQKDRATEARYPDGLISELERVLEPEPTPPTVERLVERIMGQNARIRMGLLCEIAMDEGLRWRDVPPAVRRMGYRVQRLPEFGNAEFIFADKKVA